MLPCSCLCVCVRTAPAVAEVCTLLPACVDRPLPALPCAPPRRRCLLAHVGTNCSAPLMQLPESQRQIAAVHAALRRLGALLVGKAAMAQPVPPDAQCAGVVSALVIMLAGVLPVVLAAMWDGQEPRHSPAGGRPRQDGSGLYGSQGSAADGAGEVLPQQCRHMWQAGAGQQAVAVAIGGVVALAVTLVVWDASLAVYLALRY